VDEADQGFLETGGREAVSNERIPIGVVGVGGWGKNLVRNYFQLPEAELRYICDIDEKSLRAIQQQFPAQHATQRYEDLLGDAELRAVAIATPGATHFELCRRALLAGKDVFVEKPFVLTVPHAEELIRIADASGRVLMIGHLLEYHPVVQKLRELITNGELGEVRYIYSQRLNLGTVRVDENALWNFAPHDISVILYLMDAKITDVSARGQCYLQHGIEDVVFMALNFGDKQMGHVHVSWLDPHKIRRVTIVGSQRMAVFDDLESTEKLRIYDKGAAVNSDYNTFAEYIGLRFGDIMIPYIRGGEPLAVECQHFLRCVRERQRPRSDGQDGLRVIQVLAAAEKSLAANGVPVSIA
jgi:predicted dehydrogenase